MKKEISLNVPFSIQIMRLFCEFVRVSQLWSQLKIFFSTDLDLPLLTPQSAIFGFLAETDKKGSLDISRLINKIRKIKALEKK